MPPLLYVKKGFNYAQDGPGNRLVYHLFGCNLHCPWCANPETLFNNPAVEQLMPDEILRQALSAGEIMIDSGGVTFTGGEPTAQATALKEVLILLNENEIHTAVQTNGTSAELPDLLSLLSLLIIDFKHYDDKKHKEVIGVSNAPIIENIKIACMSGLPVWIRTPLINGFNASDEDLAGFLKVYKTLDLENTSFEFLPYHEYGRDKWKKLGHDYAVTDGAVSLETKKRFAEAYSAAGLRVIST